MYWGDDLIAIYNEAYIMLAGQKHPTLMGMSYSVAWSEIWVSHSCTYVTNEHKSFELTKSRTRSRMSLRTQN
jgi:hypothetical protein